MTKINYPSINGLRAISVVLVVLSHLEIKHSIFSSFSDFILIKVFIDFLHDGNFGVNVFFVVSGFLITSILLYEESVNNKISLKNFYIRRSLRIFPAYYFLLFIYLVFYHYDLIGICNESWLASFTFTKYFNWNSDWFTAHLWSLSVEEHFYLLFPFLFIMGNGYRKKTVILFFLVVPVLRIIYHFTTISWLNDLTLFTRIDAIAIGCFCAFYKDLIIDKLRRNWTKWFYLSIIGLFTLRFFHLLSFEFNQEAFFIPFGSSYGSIANILIAIIMMYSIFGPKSNWYKFLNFKFVSYIGVLSYSIYLWQQIVIFGNFSWFSTIPEKLLLISILALISYYLIEKPFLKLKSKFSKSNLS